MKEKKSKFTEKKRKKHGLSSRDEIFCKKYMKPYSADPMKQLLFLINQFADLGVKLRAIKLYNKMRGRT